MGLIKTIKYVNSINKIVDKIDKFKAEKLDEILTAIYSLNVAVCYLESIISKAKDGLAVLVERLNTLHPTPTPVEEAAQEVVQKEETKG